LLEQFGEEMERTDPSDSSAWEKIIMQTKSAKKDLDEELESGRDRLLEMSSFDEKSSKKIVETIDAIDQDPALEGLMTDLFDQFGIAIEELGDHCYYIKPDSVFAGDAFPGMREIGMSITFDRSSAMSNEQMTFISWDHPLVSTCIDLMLNGEQGSSSFGQILGTAAETGLVAECTFLLEPVCPVSAAVPRICPNELDPCSPFSIRSMQVDTSGWSQEIKVICSLLIAEDLSKVIDMPISRIPGKASPANTESGLI
jgi:ATP-dependent helicase HepA